MKQLKDPKKIILYAIIALIIILGIVMVAIKGFNVELRYRANQKVELAIGEEVNATEIQKKADEVFGKGNSIVQVVEIYKDAVQITAESITEEQKNDLVEKVNELYPQEATEEGKEPEKLLDASKITIQSTQNAHLRDFLKPYIIPTSVITIIIIAYYAIRYHKLGTIKVILKSIIIIVLTQLLLLSILAIVRFPMGRLTTPLILLVYLTTLIYISGTLIKEQKEVKSK